MAVRRNPGARSARLTVEGLEPRNLMTARVSAGYMLIDPFTSKPLSVVSAQVANPHAPSHHMTHSAVKHHALAGNAKTNIVAKPLADASAYTGALPPSLVRHAYGLDQSGLTGAGQTIALIEAYDDPTIGTDLQAFSQRFGLPSTNLLKAVPITGKPRFDAGWAGEIALDVEWAHAMAPGATILLVEAKSTSYTDLLSAVDYAVSVGAKQVSMSWGSSEVRGLTNSLDRHFKVPGVTFTAAAGDGGMEVEHPAVSSYVTGVGGTSLQVDTAGNRLNETAWSGSGGGVSNYTNVPSYQASSVTGSKRNVPDVAFDADPSTGVLVYDSSSGGAWYQVGGTSVGAPSWAGIIAHVNQGRANAGKASLGTGKSFGTNQVLYQLAGATPRSSISADYYDITLGGNGISAKPGYDSVTGLGTPTSRLVTDLVNS